MIPNTPDVAAMTNALLPRAVKHRHVLRRRSAMLLRGFGAARKTATGAQAFGCAMDCPTICTPSYRVRTRPKPDENVAIIKQIARGCALPPCDACEKMLRIMPTTTPTASAAPRCACECPADCRKARQVSRNL